MKPKQGKHTYPLRMLYVLMELLHDSHFFTLRGDDTKQTIVIPLANCFRKITFVAPELLGKRWFTRTRSRSIINSFCPKSKNAYQLNFKNKYGVCRNNNIA